MLVIEVVDEAVALHEEVRPEKVLTDGTGHLGVLRGGALYVGALIGPGLLLVPALATQAAGAATIVAWAGLLLASAPLAASCTMKRASASRVRTR